MTAYQPLCLLTEDHGGVIIVAGPVLVAYAGVTHGFVTVDRSEIRLEIAVETVAR
jgi:hypothetical protein